MKNKHLLPSVLTSIVANTALVACGPENDASASPDTTRNTATQPAPKAAKSVPRGEVERLVNGSLQPA